MDPFVKKSLFVVGGIVLFLVVYTRLSKSPCEARISYANVDLNNDIDLEEVFAPPSDEELSQIRLAWNNFDYTSDSVLLVQQYNVAPERPLQILANYAEGNKHYGAVILPKQYDPDQQYPIVLWANGLNQVDPSVQLTHPIIKRLTTEFEHFFLIIPSYRGQALKTSQRGYCSDGFFGDAFDGATDDALRFLHLAKARFSGVDEKRVSVCGLSRGGTVALLAAARDTSIRNAVSIAGPTNFHQRQAYDRYGGQYKYQFLSTTTDMDSIRDKMLRSSPAYFIEDYQNDLLLIQGRNDQVVPVANATAVIDLLQEKKNFEHILTEGGHDFYDWPLVTEWIKQRTGE